MLQVGFAMTALLGALVMGAGQAAAVPQTPAPTGTDAVTTLIENLLKGLTTPGAPAPGAVETRQMIVATAPVATSQTATLTAFEKDDAGKWTPVIGPTEANLGEKGMGKAQDNVYRTPQGTFPLNVAFGRQDKPEGTKMEYFKTTPRDWWDSNVNSPTYNTHVISDVSPGADSENLYNMGPVYDYAVNINHNPTRTPGDASAIFLHVSDGKPTWGCVAIERDKMIEILKWLDPAKNPQMTIGVNVDAPQEAPANKLPQGDLIGGIVGNLAGLIPNILSGAAS